MAFQAGLSRQGADKKSYSNPGSASGPAYELQIPRQGSDPRQPESENFKYSKECSKALDEDSKALRDVLRNFHSKEKNYNEHFAEIGTSEQFKKFLESSKKKREAIEKGLKVTEDDLEAYDWSEDVKKIFNIEELEFDRDTKKEWYGVTFFSRLKEHAPDAMIEDLYARDERAFNEAVRFGGLLMYGAGTPYKRYNMSTCIWTDRQTAEEASNLSDHQDAKKLAEKVYEYFELGRYVVRKDKNTTRLSIDVWPEKRQT